MSWQFQQTQVFRTLVLQVGAQCHMCAVAACLVCFFLLFAPCLFPHTFSGMATGSCCSRETHLKVISLSPPPIIPWSLHCSTARLFVTSGDCTRTLVKPHCAYLSVFYCFVCSRIFSMPGRHLMPVFSPLTCADPKCVSAQLAASPVCPDSILIAYRPLNPACLPSI